MRGHFNPGTWPEGQRSFVGGTDDPTGLIQLGARPYDPKLGMFVSVDPETDEYDPQRMHPYAYANNAPLTFSDPDGRFFGFIKKAVSAVGSAVKSTVTKTVNFVKDNAETISAVASGVALVASFIPGAQPLAAAAAGEGGLSRSGRARADDEARWWRKIMQDKRRGEQFRAGHARADGRRFLRRCRGSRDR